jgi:hypothetical protein
LILLMAVALMLTGCSGEETIEFWGGTYTGELKDGLPHGQGTAIFPNGGKYVGEFKDGMYNGHGTETWPNGEEFVGEFKDNVPGRGTMIYPDGTVVKGRWENDEFIGE